MNAIEADYVDCNGLHLRTEGSPRLYGEARSGVAHKLARELIGEGQDPSTPLMLYRNGKPAFTRPMSLDWWAKWTFSEGTNQSVRRMKYKEFSAA